MNRIPFLLASLLLLSACERRTEGMELIVEGRVTTAPSGGVVPLAEVVLHERAVEDGALQAEEVVGQVESDADGRYSIPFARRSSYSLRWTASAEGHFPTAGFLDPERLLPDVPYVLDIGMPGVCTLHVHLASVAPEDSSDRMLFNLGEAFPCACCPDDPVLLEGMGADSSWQCLMYGDHWMTWGADLEVAVIGQPEGFFIDSVFCPAFGSANLELTW